MNVIRESKVSLAHAIGLCRIATVVDQFCDEVHTHPGVEEPFRVIGSCADRKACLTYFWWVTLGGERTRAINVDVVPKHLRGRSASELMREWTAMFGRVVFSVVDRDLAEAWMERAVRLSQSLQIAEESYRGQPVAAN